MQKKEKSTSELELITKKYNKLSKRIDGILKQSDRQQLVVMELTEELKDKNIKIENLLNNADQGFLYFGNDMMVGDEYSKEVINIFEEKIQNKNITQLLYPNDKKSQEFLEETLLTILNSNKIKRELLISLLEDEFVINNKFIHVDYKVIKGNVFMLILTDISDKKELDKKIRHKHQILKMIVEIVTTKEQFMEIKNDYNNMIQSIDQYKSIDQLSEFRRKVHTFKGLFAQKEMLYIVEKLHDFETFIDQSIKDGKIIDIVKNITTKTMSKWLELDIEVIKEILGSNYFEKNNQISIDKSRIKFLYQNLLEYFDNKDDEKVNNILKYTKELQYYNIAIFFRPYQKLVEQLSKRFDKPMNPLVVEDKNIYISNKYQPFINSLVHIFRNSIDHGIEISNERYEANKPEKGTITCQINKDNSNLIISISDDGKGIDTNIIKALAVEKNIYTQDEVDNLTEEEILLIIFNDSFSTSKIITDISGRGVGLASIVSELDKINGKLSIENNFRKGIKFTFIIPF